MSANKIPDYVHRLLDEIAKKHNFTNYNVVIEPSSVSGYGSDMFSIEIIDRDNSLSILCKLAPAEKSRREECISKIIFKREALFYDKVVPLFITFQNEKNVPKHHQFLSFPKCYGTVIDDNCENYAILMEDLRPQNFKVWEKPNSTPIEHLRLMMQELGKFHGLSFALKDQRPAEFAEYKQLADTLRNFLQFESPQKMMNDSYDLAIKSLKHDEHKNIIRDIKKNFMLYLDYCVNNETTNRFGVISHGDFHSNNILFQVNENGIAEDIRIVDWQTIRYVSPVIDILHTIFASTEKLLRDREVNNLLQLYHNSLSKTVKLLGSNPDEVFTLNDMYDELKRCGNYSLILAPLLTQVYQTGLASKAEDKTFDKISTDLCEEDKLEYDQRINEVIADIVDFGCYQKHCYLNKN